MRCDCCNQLLTDSEATAKFIEPDGSKPTRFVNMCKKCQSFLPPEVHIYTRTDLDDDEYIDDIINGKDEYDEEG